MQTLADTIAADLGSFLSTNEFAKSRVIDGRAVDCVLTQDENDFAGGVEIGDGLYEESWTLMCATADLPSVPMPSQVMRIDGRVHTVRAADDQQGMLTVKTTTKRV